MNRNAKQLQSKSKTHHIEQISPDSYEVTSGTSGNVYTVSRSAGNVYTCTCDWHRYHKSGECSHTISVREHIAGQSGRSLSAWGSKEDAGRQHKKSEGANEGVFFTSRIA